MFFSSTQEVFRALELRRRDIDIVAGVSPELLPAAVVKSFWMLEVRKSETKAAQASNSDSNLFECSAQLFQTDEPSRCECSEGTDRGHLGSIPH